MDVFLGGTVLSQNPECAGTDSGGADVSEAVHQASQDGASQLGAGFQHLTHKEDDVQRACSVHVAQEVCRNGILSEQLNPACLGDTITG